MLTCFMCRMKIPNIKSLKSHFTLLHGPKTLRTYRCIEDNCNRQFQLFNSLRRHIVRAHSTNITNNDSLLLPNTVNLETSCTVDPVREQQLLPCSSSALTPSESLPCNDIVETGLSMFLASLYANQSLPRKVIQSVVSGLTQFITNPLLLALKTELENLTSNNNIQKDNLNTVINKIESLLTDPLTKLNTEYKRLKYFKNKETYIEPETLIIGERLEKVKQSGITRLQPVTCEQHFIPLRKVLKAFFSLGNILSETLNYIRCLNETSENFAIENFIQGSFWRSRLRQRQGKTVIPIFVFFDDFETGNALGSRAGQHKLGAVYASIPCLPPCRSSVLRNIFLLLLFHSSDRILFGNHIIFQCVIDELNYLNEHGIEFNLPDFNGVIHFELGLILGDNLGIHAITGFVESFSANYSCRVCKVSKQVMKTQCIENQDILRNLSNYESDLLLNNPSETGIKEKCVWLAVKDFDLFNQVGVDCMHDILEGVAKYVMQFVLLQFIRHFKFFTLAELNHKIHGFDYGPDRRNQPCTLSMDHLNHGNVRLSSSEMLTFLRYMGLLVGELVPKGNEIWKLYQKLRTVLEITQSSAFAQGTEELLQTAVMELNTLYLSLTTDSLKPKFHNLVHYHRMLEKYGPIVSLWSMRFEAKHRVFKMASNVSCNRKNITLSLTSKHQLQLNELLLQGKLPDILRTGPVPCDTCNDSDKQFIRCTLQLCPNKSLARITWATVSTTRYVKGTILIYDTNSNDSLPMFFKVENVYLYDSNDLIVMGILMQTLEYDDHFIAYEVTESEAKEHVVKYHKKLVSPIPCNINVLSNGKKYVTLRCAL